MGRSEENGPCQEHDEGLAIDCAFSGPVPNIVNTVSGLVSRQCTYVPPNPNTVWGFGCGLGGPAEQILDVPPVLTSVEDT